MLYLKCKGQVVSIVEDERLADKYINANTVHFEFCERWADMRIVAQFTQGENTYDVEVDEVTNTVTMPNEITAGDVLISAFGVHPITGVRITTIPVKKTVDKSGFVGDGETPIPPTPDLYTQLINHVDERAVKAEEEIAKGVEDYLEKNPVNSVVWDNVSGKPKTYPPDEHKHSYTDLENQPNSLPNPFALTINGESYDGSSAVNMNISTDGGDAAKLGGKAASEYLQKSQVVNNFTTTEEGFVADARAVAALDEKIASGLKMFNMTSSQKLTIKFRSLFGGMAIFIRNGNKAALKLCAFAGDNFTETALGETVARPIVTADFDTSTVTIEGSSSTHAGIILYGSLNSHYTSHTVTAI